MLTNPLLALATVLASAIILALTTASIRLLAE